MYYSFIFSYFISAFQVKCIPCSPIRIILSNYFKCCIGVIALKAIGGVYLFSFHQQLENNSIERNFSGFTENQGLKQTAVARRGLQSYFLFSPAFISPRSGWKQMAEVCCKGFIVPLGTLPC